MPQRKSILGRRLDRNKEKRNYVEDKQEDTETKESEQADTMETEEFRYRHAKAESEENADNTDNADNASAQPDERYGTQKEEIEAANDTSENNVSHPQSEEVNEEGLGYILEKKDELDPSEPETALKTSQSETAPCIPELHSEVDDTVMESVRENMGMTQETADVIKEMSHSEGNPDDMESLQKDEPVSVKSEPDIYPAQPESARRTFSLERNDSYSAMESLNIVPPFTYEQGILIAACTGQGICIALSNTADSNAENEAPISTCIMKKNIHNGQIESYLLNLSMESACMSCRLPINDFRCREDIMKYTSSDIRVNPDWNGRQLCEFCKSIIQNAMRMKKIYENSQERLQSERYHIIFIPA